MALLGFLWDRLNYVTGTNQQLARIGFSRWVGIMARLINVVGAVIIRDNPVSCAKRGKESGLLCLVSGNS